jgi:hypothetical protein
MVLNDAAGASPPLFCTSSGELADLALVFSRVCRTVPAPDRRRTMDKQKIGEGNYEAAAEFQAEQHEFARSGKVEKKAREAAQAVDGPEGEKLEKARAAAAKGKTE